MISNMVIIGHGHCAGRAAAAAVAAPTARAMFDSAARGCGAARRLVGRCHYGTGRPARISYPAGRRRGMTTANRRVSAAQGMKDRRLGQSATPHTIRNKSTSSSRTSKRRKATLAANSMTAEGGRASANAANNASSAAASATASTTSRRTIQERLEAVMRKPRTIPIPRWITPKMHTITLSEVCGHSSFILVAISYAVDDFLMLRCMAVAGSTVMLFFAYFHPYGRVLWLPFKWNALFILLNSYRIGKVFVERYYAEQLSDYWLQFRNKNFYLMDPIDFARLVNLGSVKEFHEGDVIIAQGEYNPNVGLVLQGTFKVFRDGTMTYLLEEANFFAESGLHAGLMLEGRVESCGTVVCASPNAQILTWDRTGLVTLMHRFAGVRRSLKAILSWDIVRKLKSQRELLANGAIEDPEKWTEERNLQTQKRYECILENALSQPEFLEERRKQLEKYRFIHHLDDEVHRQALERLGWTVEEYENGYRHDDNEAIRSLEYLKLRMQNYARKRTVPASKSFD